MIPETFDPPRTHDFGAFKLAVLAPCFAAQDFQAVHASADTLHSVFSADDGWPDPQMTFEENLADLTRHAREFDERVAFAYALLSTTGDQYVGCLYIYRIKSRREHDRRKTLFQAQAFLWLNVLQTTVSDELALSCIQTWLSTTWPLTQVAWPGRVQTWSEWEALADSL